jgi:hypothetical protein
MNITNNLLQYLNYSYFSVSLTLLFGYGLYEIIKRRKSQAEDENVCLISYL